LKEDIFIKTDPYVNKEGIAQPIVTICLLGLHYTYLIHLDCSQCVYKGLKLLSHFIWKV